MKAAYHELCRIRAYDTEKDRGIIKRIADASRGLDLTPMSFMNIQSDSGPLYKGNVKEGPGAMIISPLLDDGLISAILPPR
jgi:hypothetical protein